MRCLAPLLSILQATKATYSIVATDGVHIGASGSTCIELEGFSILNELYREEPGAGVLITQANLIEEDSAPVVAGKALLANGTDPQDILTVMTDPMLDPDNFTVGDGEPDVPNVDTRQYAALDVQGRVAGYTGPSLDELYARFGFEPSSQSDQQVITEDYTVSAQGNIVTDATVPLLIDSFQEAATDNVTNCDLAAKLYAASIAVSMANQGDIRCDGVPGSLAFLRVDTVDGETVLEIDIQYSEAEGLVNPYEKLKEGYDAWRAENSCGEPTEAPPPTTSAAIALVTSMTGILIGGMATMLLMYDM